MFSSNTMFYCRFIPFNFLSGYKVSGSHVESNSAKTNAKPEVIWDLMRSWRLAQNPVPDLRYDKSFLYVPDIILIS